MRAHASALSVPVSLVFAIEAVASRQPLIAALGILLMFVIAGYLVSELQLRRDLHGRVSHSALEADETRNGPELRKLELNRPSLGERIFPIVFVVATVAIALLLAVYAAGLPGG